MAAATPLALWTRTFTLSGLAVIRRPLSCRTFRAMSTDSRSFVTAPVNDHWKLVETTVSSLRTDNIAAAGLGLSRRRVWEAWADQRLLKNGQVLTHKRQQVKEGDVVELDMERPVRVSRNINEDGSPPESGEEQGKEGVGTRWRRSRVVVHAIGSTTKSGRHYVNLKRIIEFCSLLPAPPCEQLEGDVRGD